MTKQRPLPEHGQLYIDPQGDVVQFHDFRITRVGRPAHVCELCVYNCPDREVRGITYCKDITPQEVNKCLGGWYTKVEVKHD